MYGAVVVSVFFSEFMNKRHDNREAATDTSHQNASNHVTKPALLLAGLPALAPVLALPVGV